MNLPDNSIGITDIEQYRRCPARFEFGMQRHTAKGDAPEADSTSNAYGSAIHDAISFMDEHGATVDEAVDAAFAKWYTWLEPDDMELLKEDLATYQARVPPGAKTVINEGEVKVPLFVDDRVGQVYYRGRIDRLYQRLDNPEVFIHVDYKSSKWEKTEAEVHSDTQLWSYNWALHEHVPEIGTLVQIYDQLRYGTVPTSKNAAQRAQIKEWLIRQAKVIIADVTMEAKFNEFCPWCPLLASCGVVRNLTEFATSRLVALAPPHKVGRKTVMELDPLLLDVYAEPLDEVKRAKQVLDIYERTVKEAIKEAPQAVRDRLGFKLTSRNIDDWSSEALVEVHDLLRQRYGAALGDDIFYRLVSMSKTRVEQHVPDDDAKAIVLNFAERKQGTTSVKKISR